MQYQHLLFEIQARVAVVTFHRPDQLNAMNRRLMEEIIHAVGRINTEPGVRVGMLTGAGRAFMAGADIKEYASQTEEAFHEFQILGRSLYAGIEGNRRPIIAAVNGHAFGGGFEIALACDLLVAAAGAKFALPEILLHLIPGGGGTQRLTARLGLSRANELLMTGATVTADTLHSWGLINHIYPRESFPAEALAFATALAERAPEPLTILKQLTRVAAGPMNTAAQALENEALGRFYRSPDGQQKIREFASRGKERTKESTRTDAS